MNDMPESQGLLLLNYEVSCIFQAQEQISLRVMRNSFISHGF